MAKKINPKQKTKQILESLSLTPDNDRSCLIFREYLENNGLENLMNDQYLDFKYKLKVLKSFEITLANVIELSPRVFIQEIVKLLDGDFNKTKIHHRHYYKIKIKLSNSQYSILCYAGSIKCSNPKQEILCVVLIGFFIDSNYHSVKSMFKNSGIMFMKQAKEKTDSIKPKKQETVIPELKRIIKGLITEHRLFIQEFWKVEGINIDSPKVFLIYYLGLQSKKGKDRNYEYSENQLKVINLNPFESYGLDVNISCSNAAYKILKNDFYKESLNIVDIYCAILLNKSNFNFKIKRYDSYPYIMVIKYKKINSKIALCIYISCDSFSNLESGITKNVFNYRAEFITDTIIKKIPENIQLMNNEIENHHKNKKIPPIISVIDEAYGKFFFNSLDDYTYNSEPLKIFLAAHQSQDIQLVRIIIDEKEQDLKKLNYKGLPNFSIFNSEVLLIPNTSFKIKIKGLDIEESINAQYKGGAALFFPKNLIKSNIFDYESFKFFVMFIADNNLMHLMGSLVVSTKMQTDKLINYYKKFLDEISNYEDDVVFLVLSTYFEIKNLESNYKLIILEHLQKFSSNIRKIQSKNYSVDLFQYFTQLFIKFSNFQDQEIIEKLETIIKILTEENYKEQFKIQICKLLIEDTSLTYNRNLAFIEEVLIANEISKTNEILLVIIMKSSDFLAMLKSYALMNEDNRAFRIIKNRILNCNKKQNVINMNLKDLNEILTNIKDSKKLLELSKELNDQIFEIISKSIKNSVQDRKITFLESLINDNENIFFKNIVLKLETKIKIFQELLLTKCFEISFYQFFINIFENIAQTNSVSYLDLLGKYITNWVYYFKDKNIDLIKEMMRELNNRSIFSKLIQNVCDALTDKRMFENIKIDKKESDIFSHINFFYEFIKFQELFENYKKQVMESITIYNYQTQFKFFTCLNKEIKDSEIGDIIIYSIASVYPVPTGNELENEFYKIEAKNELFILLCNIQIKNLNENKIRDFCNVEKALFDNVKKFFMKLEDKSILVKYIKNLLEENYFNKISTYFDFYLINFKPKSTEKNLILQLRDDYLKIKTQFENIRKLFEFLQNNFIKTDKNYLHEFKNLTSQLEIKSFIYYKIPEKYQKLISPSLKLINLRCFSKIEKIMIQKFTSSKNVNLDEIEILIESEYENLEKNCKQLSSSTLDSKLSDFLSFLSIFDNYEDLIRLQKEMNLDLPVFIKKIFDNLKIKDYFEKACISISSCRGFFKVEKQLIEKCKVSASLISECGSLSFKKFLKIFELEQILTDFTENEDKKAYYIFIDALDKHSDLISYLLSTKELSDSNIFEELIIELNDEIIRKDDKYNDGIIPKMNIDLTPEIVIEFKIIRNTFLEISSESLNFETLKSRLQRSTEENLKITKMLETNEPFFKNFKDLISRNFDKEIYLKNKISSICKGSNVEFWLEKQIHYIKILSEEDKFELFQLVDMKEKVLLEKKPLASDPIQIQNENFSNFISFVDNLEEICQKHRRALTLGVSFPSTSFCIHYDGKNLENFLEYNNVLQQTLDNIEERLDESLKNNYSFTFLTSTNFRLIEEFLVDENNKSNAHLNLISLTTFINPSSTKNKSMWNELYNLRLNFKSFNQKNKKNQTILNSCDINLNFNELSSLIFNQFMIKLDFIQKFLIIVSKNQEIITNESNNSGIFECKTDDTKMALISIFLKFSITLPFCNQFFQCRSSTEWIDLKTFMFRYFHSPISQLFALLEPENLEFSIQKKLIDFLSKLYEEQSMKPISLYIITSVSSNPLSDYLRNCSKGLKEYQNTETIDSEKMRKIVPGLSEISSFYSTRPGTGKSSLIKNTQVGKLFYFELRISGNFNEKVLKLMLDIESFCKPCLYHIVLAVTENNKYVYDFLYYFIVFRCVFIKETAFFIHLNSKICIEIEDVKSFEKISGFFPLLKFINTVEVDFKDLESKLQIDSKMENVSRIKYLLLKQKLDDKTLDIPIEKDILASTILNDIISQEQEILNNFYQINQYFSILDFIFSNFRNSIYNTDTCSALIEELEKSKQKDLSIYLKNQKTLIVTEIFKTIKNFCSRLENPDNENEDEDPEICKKWKEVYILFIYFNSSGSLFVLTDDDSKYPEDLKVISTIQSAYVQDSIESQQLNSFSRFFKNLRGFDYSKLKVEITNKQFKYKTIKKNHDSLISNLIEIADKPMSILSSTKNFDEFKNYVLTLDNLIKMVLIYIRSKAGLPIVIMGESGCGKTALIKYFVINILQQKFLNYSINAGTDLKMVDKYIKEIKTVSEILKKSKNAENSRLWVFFDEFNTSECVSYFSQILIEKRFKNEDLPSNIIWVGACNPCKLKKENEDDFAIPKSNHSVKQNIKNLVHNVKKLPLKILEHIWDFGSIEKDHLMLYISSITEKIFTSVTEEASLLTCIKGKSTQMIFSAHEFHLENEGGSSVSLRDVSRFTDLSLWFYNYRNFFFTEASNTSSDILDSNIFKSCILAFMHCYYLRISSTDLRKKFLERSAKIIETDSNFLLNIMKNAQSFLMDQMEEKEGIAKNPAIKENIYSIIPCICNKIPVFICGKPGSSKSLAAGYVLSSMKGKDSKSKFFKELPELFQIYYQGSHSSTSKEIENIFKKAEDCNLRYKNENLNKIPVILFDEVGLAELSVHNPLKVIHKYLEHENKNFGFIAISNWKMDASKMNRTLYLNRIVPECDELQDIAENVYNSFKIFNEPKEVEIIRRSAKIYYLILESFKNNKNFRNFYGLRDFYGTIKYMCKAFKNNKWKNYQKIILKAFFHNFGGTLGIYKKLVDDYFKNIFQEFSLNEDEIPKTLELIGWSLADKDSRFIMAISNSDVALFLLKNHVQRSTSTLTILVGSQFELDKQSDQHLSKKISEISTYISKDTTLILTGLERVYPSLYDLLNQNFIVKGDKKYCKITIGANCNHGSHVNDNLKIIIVEDDTEKHLLSIDPPFLNRFEKYQLNLNEIMTQFQKDHAEDQESLIKTLYSSRQEGINITQEIVFPICDPLNLKFMSLNPNCSFLGECSCIDIILKNSSADINYMLNDDSNKTKRLIEKIQQFHQTTFFEDLEIILKESSEKCSKLLALTYDPEELRNEYFDKIGISRKIVDFSREQVLKTEINLFFKEHKKIFVLEIDFNNNHGFLFQVISILDCFINEYRKEGKVVVILVRLSRNDSERHKLIYEPSWVSKMYDSLNRRRSSYIDLSVKYSQELILKEPDHEKKLKNEIVSLIKQSFFCIKFNKSISEFNFEKHRKFIIEQFGSNDQLCSYFCKKVFLVLEKRLSKKEKGNLIENLLFQNNSIKMEAKNTFHALELIKMNELLNCVSILVLNLEYYSSFTSICKLFSDDFSRIIDPVIDKIIEESNEHSFSFQLYQNNITVLDHLHFPFIKRLYFKSLILLSTKEDHSINSLRQNLSEFFYIFSEIEKKDLIKDLISDYLEVICEEVNFKYEKNSLIEIIITHLMCIKDIVKIISVINSKKETILCILRVAEIFCLSVKNIEKYNIFDAETKFKYFETDELFKQYQENNTWKILIELIISIIVSQCIFDKKFLFKKDHSIAMSLFELLERISKNERINEIHLKNLNYIYELLSINNIRNDYLYLISTLKAYNILANISILTEINDILFGDLKKFNNHQKFILLTYFLTLKLKPEIIENAPILYSLPQTGKIIYSVDILNWVLEYTQINVKLNIFNDENQIFTQLTYLIQEKNTFIKNLEKAIKSSSNFKFMFMNQLNQISFSNLQKISNSKRLSLNSSPFFIQNVKSCKKLLEANNDSIPEIFEILKLLKLKETLEIFLYISENLSNSGDNSEYLNAVEELFGLKSWKDLIYSYLFRRLNNQPSILQNQLKNKDELNQMHHQINQITEIIYFKPLVIFEYNRNEGINSIINRILELEAILNNRTTSDVYIEEYFKIFLNLRNIAISIQDLYDLLQIINYNFDAVDFYFIRYSIIFVYSSQLINLEPIILEKFKYTSICSYFKNHIFLVSRLIKIGVNQTLQNQLLEEMKLKITELKTRNPCISIPIIFMFLLNELIKIFINNQTIQEALMLMNDENYQISLLHPKIENYSFCVIEAFNNRERLSYEKLLKYYFSTCLVNTKSLFTPNFYRRTLQQSDFINQFDKGLYPCVKVFLDYEAEISALNKLSSIIIFSNHLLRMFSFKLTRLGAKEKKIKEFFSNHSDTETLFQKFETSLKFITSNMEKMTLVGKKPDIRILSSLDQSFTLNYFLVDENKNDQGIYLSNLIKYMREVHNEFALLIRKIKKEKNSECLDMKRYKIQGIYNSKINYSKHTIRSIYQNFSINDPSGLCFETFYDLETLENSLLKLFSIDKVLETGDLDTIQYSNEIFNSSSKHKDLVQELRLKGYSEKLDENSKKQLIDSLKKIKDKNEILKVVFQVMIYLKQMDCDTFKSISLEKIIVGDSGIKETLPSFIKNNQIIKSIEVRTIVTFLEIIEESFSGDLNAWIIEGCKKESIKEEYLQKFFKNYNENFHPSIGEIKLALKRVMLRNLNSEIDISEPILGYFENKSIWEYSEKKIEQVEKMLDDCLSAEMPIENIYAFYKRLSSKY